MFAKRVFAATSFCFFAQVANAAPYDDSVARLDRLVDAHPELVTPMDIGTNDQGVLIRGVRIEGSEARGMTKPKHLVVGTHHGNEQLSAEVAHSFAERLVAALEDPNAPFHAELSKSVYYVIPVLNVSGFNAGRREESSRTGRTMDPNRDYPDPCTTDQPYQLASTGHLADFVGREEIVAAVTIHGYIGTFTYPWGIFTTNTHTPDHTAFQAMSREVVAVNRYSTGTHADAIYPTAGAFEDWAYFEHGVWVMLLEIANRPNVARDADSLLKYFAVAPETRSTQHTHVGRCTNVPLTIIARP
jgi:carboxypeptidase T